MVRAGRDGGQHSQDRSPQSTVKDKIDRDQGSATSINTISIDPSTNIYNRRRTYSIRGAARDGGHDRRQDMLLDREVARVKGVPEDGHVRHEARPHAADGEDEQLGDELPGP